MKDDLSNTVEGMKLVFDPKQILKLAAKAENYNKL